MFNLDIKRNTPITSENIGQYDVDKKEYNVKDILNYSWKIIPYDYNDNNNDMVYYELIIEGRSIDNYSKENVEIIDKNNTLYMKTNNIMCRHKLNNIVREELSYYLDKYKMAENKSKRFNDMSPWEFFDLKQKFILFEDDLDKRGLNLESFIHKSKHKQLDIINEEINDSTIQDELLEFIIEMENVAEHMYN